MPSAPRNSSKGFSTGEQDAAVDTAGNVYVITSNGVVKLAPGSNSWAVDPHGENVYVADHLGSRAPGGGTWFGIWHPKDDAQVFVLKLPTG